MNPYYVKDSRYGRGVFASRDIKKGEKIFVMNGETISGKNLSEVTSFGRNILVDPLQIGDNKFINMNEPYVLVNHSCNPNAGIKKNIILTAIKNIKENEEITYDYSTVWFEGFRCKCGNKNCRGYISDFLSLPKKNKKMYLKLGVVSEFIKNKKRLTE